MEFEILETERIKLTKVTPAVYDYIYLQYTDDACIQFLGLKNEEELVAEKEKYRQGLSSYDKTFLYFLLTEKQSNTVIGMCGYVRYYPKHFRAEFGYALYSETVKNKGYMSEVVPHIIKYGFEHMKLQRIEALVGTENPASLKIIKKLGFQKEGLLQHHYHRNGKVEDSLIFSLLNT